MDAAPLTPAQCDGIVCVVCGAGHRAMVPLGVETRSSTDLFRCNRPECVATPDEVRAQIPASQRVHHIT